MHANKVIKLFYDNYLRKKFLELVTLKTESPIFWQALKISLIDEDDFNNRFIFSVNDEVFSVDYYQSSYDDDPAIYYPTIEPVKQVTKTITVWEKDEERY